MRYVKLGTTGLDVSPIALGCMSYGEPDRGHPSWSLDEEQSRPLIKQAIESGINFFDTANMYSQGSSEEITGRALKDFANRDEIVIATKLRHPMRSGPNGSGLSRKESSPRSITASNDWAPTTSTSIRSTGTTRRPRWKRRSRRYTTWSRRARSATSEPHQ